MVFAWNVFVIYEKTLSLFSNQASRLKIAQIDYVESFYQRKHIFPFDITYNIIFQHKTLKAAPYRIISPLLPWSMKRISCTYFFITRRKYVEIQFLSFLHVYT